MGYEGESDGGHCAVGGIGRSVVSLSPRRLCPLCTERSVAEVSRSQFQLCMMEQDRGIRCHQRFTTFLFRYKTIQKE